MIAAFAAEPHNGNRDAGQFVNSSTVYRPKYTYEIYPLQSIIIRYILMKVYKKIKEPMSILSLDKKIQAIAALTEGVSIRATERLTDIHRDTIMRLGVRVGEGCARLHDQIIRNVQVAHIELDEVWSFVGKKQKRVTHDDGANVGDQYLFTALDATGKAILSYTVGKRTAENTQAFVADLRERVINRPTISSDAFNAYPEAVELAFGADVDYGQIQKVFAGELGPDAARKYSPGQVEGVNYRRVSGDPNRICTSYVERSNLTVRMQSRRFTRLTNGFSKKLRNHKAAISLFIAHYNFYRVHETIRMTPAMMLGVTDHIWSIAELIDAATCREAPEPAGRRVGRLRVIDGGLS